MDGHDYEEALERRVTSWRDVLCPYCGNSHKFEAHDMPWNDGDVMVEECHRCRKRYVLTAHTSTTWTTDAEEY